MKRRLQLLDREAPKHQKLDKHYRCSCATLVPNPVRLCPWRPEYKPARHWGSCEEWYLCFKTALPPELAHTLMDYMQLIMDTKYRPTPAVVTASKAVISDIAVLCETGPDTLNPLIKLSEKVQEQGWDYTHTYGVTLYTPFPAFRPIPFHVKHCVSCWRLKWWHPQEKNSAYRNCAAGNVKCKWA